MRLFAMSTSKIYVLSRKDFVKIRKHGTPSIKCFTKREHFISCIKVAFSALFLLINVSRIQEAVKKNPRLDVTKNIQAEGRKFTSFKETFIWSKIYRVVDHSVNMGFVEILVGNLLEKE